MKPKQIQDNNKVGLYMRLSKDDERSGESLSIENQRGILTGFVKEHGWEIVDEYIDDGVSGTTFERPEVQRLLDDAKSGRIDVIIVKDLSRFGRNYIQVGQYVDYIFPMYNIRFIAISDNVDTANTNSSGMDMMPIMNVFNEWHSANTSKKIRAVVESKAKAGKYVAKNAPYGYRKTNDEKQPLVIDEEAATIVRRIFEQRATGMPVRKIADMLNDEKVLIPADYVFKKFGIFVKGSKHLWAESTVRNILKNEEYLGKVIRLRKTKVSYKTKRKVEREPYVFPNMFDPIITQEMWDRVRELDRSVSRGKRTNKGEMHPLSGLLYCPDCGGKMKLARHYVKPSKKKPDGWELLAYTCGNFARFGKHYCFNHYIRTEELDEVVLADIRAKATFVNENEAKARAEFLRYKEQVSNDKTKADRKALEQKQRRYDELEGLIQSVYEDKVEGKIPEDICLKLLTKYSDEQKELQPEIEALQQSLATVEKNEADVDEFVRRLKKLEQIPELTRELAIELIDRITVGAAPKEKNGAREIHIYYKLLNNQTV